jgi:hypothetical protein
LHAILHELCALKIIIEIVFHATSRIEVSYVSLKVLEILYPKLLDRFLSVWECVAALSPYLLASIFDSSQNVDILCEYTGKLSSARRQGCPMSDAHPYTVRPSACTPLSTTSLSTLNALLPRPLAEGEIRHALMPYIHI